MHCNWPMAAWVDSSNWILHDMYMRAFDISSTQFRMVRYKMTWRAHREFLLVFLRVSTGRSSSSSMGSSAGGPASGHGCEESVGLPPFVWRGGGGGGGGGGFFPFDECWMAVGSMPASVSWEVSAAGFFFMGLRSFAGRNCGGSPSPAQ